VMSETTVTEEVPAEGSSEAFPVRLMYAVYAALAVDAGCIIGAIVFILLIVASAVFAPQLTPCTSAGGIPCAH
jgi:hypothetical protein